MASSYDSDMSIEETNEGDSIEDTIEVLEEPRALKSKRVQQKQTETMPPMVTNLHLLEAIQVSHTSIGKLQDKQVHIEKITKEMYSQIEEWFTYMRAQTKTLQGEVGEAKEELEEVRAELV